MGIDTNVGADMTQTVGAAQAEIVIGSRAEEVTGNKDEKAIGLVVLSKGGESEKVGGSKTTMVGGLIYDKLKGTHQIEAGGPGDVHRRVPQDRGEDQDHLQVRRRAPS
jgi:type VI secretion system secreted protein VgrG